MAMIFVCGVLLTSSFLPVHAIDSITVLEQQIIDDYGVSVSTVHPDHLPLSDEHEILVALTTSQAEGSLQKLQTELKRITPFWQNHFTMEFVVGATKPGNKVIGLATMWWNSQSPLVRCELQVGTGFDETGERVRFILFHELLHCFNKADQYRIVNEYRTLFTVSEYVSHVWGKVTPQSGYTVDLANEELSEYFGYIMTGMDFGLQNKPEYANPNHEQKLQFVYDRYASLIVDPYLVQSPVVQASEDHLNVVYTTRTWVDGKIAQIDYYNGRQSKVRQLVFDYETMEYRVTDLVSGYVEVLPLQ